MYYKIRLNEQGYTLVQALFNVICFVIMSQLVTMILLVYFKETNMKEARDNLEWELFVVDLNIYFERSHSVYTDKSGKTVYFSDPKGKNGNNYLFQVREKHIVKASYYGGHEIVLPHVSNAKFELKDGILKVTALMNSGIRRERSFVVVTYEK